MPRYDIWGVTGIVCATYCIGSLRCLFLTVLIAGRLLPPGLSPRTDAALSGGPMAPPAPRCTLRCVPNSCSGSTGTLKSARMFGCGNCAREMWPACTAVSQHSRQCHRARGMASGSAVRARSPLCLSSRPYSPTVSLTFKPMCACSQLLCLARHHPVVPFPFRTPDEASALPPGRALAYCAHQHQLGTFSAP